MRSLRGLLVILLLASWFPGNGAKKLRKKKRDADTTVPTAEAAASARSRHAQNTGNTPEFVEAANAAAKLMEQGKTKEAIRAFGKAIDLSPHHASAGDLHYNRGSLYKKAGQVDEALEDFDMAFQRNPKDKSAPSVRAGLLKQQARLEEALAYYGFAIDLAPQNKQTLYNQGNLLMKMKKFEEAEGSFERAIAIDNRFSKAMANLGIVQRQLHKEEEAEVTFAQAKAINPEHVKIESHVAGPSGIGGGSGSLL